MPEIIDFGSFRMRFLHSKDQTAGSLDVFEMTLQPNARMPIPHYHESWDETVYGVAGTATFQVDGKEVAVGPGESLFIKRGVVHGFSNPSGAPATVLGILSPGVLGTAYFREVAALAAGGAPDPARMKELMLRYGLVPAPQA